MPLVRKPRGGGGHHRRATSHSDDDESTPICRCRVLYLGSAVPHITKDGLQGIQEPLKELYPDTGLSSLKGIDSWLSVWSNGLLLENVDEKNTKITRFFPIESLHYCAAVRNVLVPASANGNISSGGGSTGSGGGGSSGEKVQKFLPLDSPFARLPNLNHPPLFACILRRTSGIKVLECHAFICKREMAANALVRCCFHAYADSTYAKQLENGGGGSSGASGILQQNGMTNGYTNGGGSSGGHSGGFKEERTPIQRSVTPLNSIEKVTGWQALSQNGDSDIIVVANSTDDDFTDGPMSSSTPHRRSSGQSGGGKFEFRAEFPADDDDDIYEGDENHKIWGGSGSMGHNGTSELLYLETDGTLKSVKSHGSRVSRPRQFISPPPPPPPPPVAQQYSLLKSMTAASEDDSASTKKKTKKKLKKEIKSGKYLVRPASMMNLSSTQPMLHPGISPPRAGSVINGPVSMSMNHGQRPGSAMSTLTRNRIQHPGNHLVPVPQHHGLHNGYHVVPQSIYGPLPPPHFALPPQMVKHSKMKKKKQQQMQQQMTPVPLLAPMPHQMQMIHPGMQNLPPHHHQSNGPYFHHPHHPQQQQHYYQQQHQHQQQQHHPKMGPVSTEIEQHHHSSNNYNNINHQKGMIMNGGMSKPSRGERDHHREQQQHIMMGAPQYATIERGYHYRINGSNGNGESSTLLSNKSKSKTRSKDDSDRSSPFNTGIYRKKGHLNERAFSYSIRQEHRSRSYSSLANLQFANETAGGPVLRASGSPPDIRPEGVKKEREIIQMVRDLDLSGDEIERSAVPPEMYPPSRKVNGYRQQNGHGPRITHR